jgi:hypothetical protein
MLFEGGLHPAIMVAAQLMGGARAAIAALSYSRVARHRLIPSRVWDSAGGASEESPHPCTSGGGGRGEGVLAEPAQMHYHAWITLGAEYYHVIHPSVRSMEDKARLTILIDPAKKKAFEELCTSQDMTSSQMVRLLIRQYLEKHGVQYVPAAESKKSGRR